MSRGVRTGKYRSRFESELGEGILKGCKYETVIIHYEKKTKHRYTGDFVNYKEGNKMQLLELKGCFRDTAERQKYLFIQTKIEEMNKKNKRQIELIFVFMNPDVPIPGSKPRKDGTRMTHSDWAEKNGFRWFTKQTIGSIL